MEIAYIGPSAEACPQTVAAIVGIVRRVAVSIFRLPKECATVETVLPLTGFLLRFRKRTKGRLRGGDDPLGPRFGRRACASVQQRAFSDGKT